MKNIKRVLTGALLSLFALLPLAALIPQFVGTASAASYPTNTGTKDIMGIVAYMTGNSSSPTSYTVTATRATAIPGGQYKNSITFSYKASGISGIDSHPMFFADLGNPIVEITGCDPTNATSVGQNSFDISVTKNGKSVFGGESVNMCTSSPVGALYQAGTIAVQDNQSQTGTISGQFTYNANDGSGEQPFVGANTNATITQQFGSKSVIHLSVDKNGYFTKSGLTPGQYTLDASYDPCPGAVCQKPVYGPATITVKAGKQDLGTLNSSTEPPPGNDNGSTDTPTCESTTGDFGWLLCAVIDAMENTVGGIYDNVVQPLLVTKPLIVSSKDPIFMAWSNFRIYGDVFLVIAIMVIVFGESIGGGMIDAYTAKKILPRLLVAAILINLSYYIVAVLVDITNVVGDGLMDLITRPFGLTGDFTLQIGTTGATTLTAVLAAAVTWAAVSLAGQWLAWLWFCILLPLLLIFLSILAVVLLRRALIVFLVIISPVAFALYCLPNTEKYFRKWWEILSQTLLVYPIIASMFAMGKVGAYLINHSGGDNFALKAVAQVMSIVAFAIPLLLIPFSFRLAGGILGRMHDALDGARVRAHKFTEGSRERIRGQGARQRIQSRAKLYSGMQSEASKGGTFRRKTLGNLLKVASVPVGGYNIEAAASAARAEQSKVLNDQIATGKDDEIRGLTVNKRTSKRRVADDGTVQYETLGGAWVSEADVDAGHRRWGNDTFAQQAALSYEMRKALDEGQVQNVAKNFASVAQGPGGWGMNDQQASGAWIGAAFERQNEHLEYKSTDWKTGRLKADSAGIRGAGLVDEIYEKRGSYNVAQMGSNTVEQLKDAHTSASETITRSDQAIASEDAILANTSISAADRTAAQDRRKQAVDARTAAVDQQEKIAGIAETFMHSYGSMPGAEPGDAPRPTPGTAPGDSGRRQANTPGAAHVAERVRELAVMTGVGPGGAAPTGGYSDPSHAPTPNQREQS